MTDDGIWAKNQYQIPSSTISDLTLDQITNYLGSEFQPVPVEGSDVIELHRGGEAVLRLGRFYNQEGAISEDTFSLGYITRSSKANKNNKGRHSRDVKYHSFDAYNIALDRIPRKNQTNWSGCGDETHM
ncbi:MAG: hypothetical protein ABIB43_06710 [archaeon]